MVERTAASVGCIPGVTTVRHEGISIFNVSEFKIIDIRVMNDQTNFS